LRCDLDFAEAAEALLEDAIASDYAGYDPFDGLNSILFQRSGLNRYPLVRLAWVQLFKRMPINFRPIVQVPKKRNPKGIALFVLGILEDYQRTSEPALLEKAIQLGDWLLEQRSNPAEWPHFAWGYHFDWQARAFFVPAGRPNVVTTWYVAKALLELTVVCGDDRYREAALSAGNFVAESLYTEADGARYFAYIPGERAFVHNASLWGAALVILLAKERGDERLLNLGLTVARESANMQAADGSWLYGTLPHHNFIDGFHTGFNLEALALITKHTGTKEFERGIELGLKYYRENLFEVDGAAKYYHNTRFPLDMHSVAQAVITFLRVSSVPSDSALAEKVMSWALRNMYIPSKKRFFYQINRFSKNPLNYTRWTQAWSYYALAMLNRHRAESNALKLGLG
jgi:polysaccharide biosynthesis protein VpsJ